MKLDKKIVKTMIILSIFITAGIVQSHEESIIDNEIIKNQSISQESCTQPIDWWPMFHHDTNNSGFSNSIGPITNNVFWIYNTTGIVNSPVLDNGKIFFTTNKDQEISGSESLVFCLDLFGEVIWTRDTYDTLVTSPALYNGNVYVGSKNGAIYCLDQETGLLNWVQDAADLELSSIIPYENNIYFGSYDGSLYCLDSTNGYIKWSTQIGIEIHATPAIFNDKVYIGNLCVHAHNGNKLWRSGIGSHLLSSPALYKDQVICAAINEFLYSHNAQNGSIVWDYYTGSLKWEVSPAIAYEKIYVGTAFGYIYCLNAEDGSCIWSTKNSDRAVTSPVICSEKVYIGSYDGKFYCLNANTGETIWSYEINDVFSTTPAIANGAVYVGCGNSLYCFGPDDLLKPDLESQGSIRWEDVKPNSVVRNNFTITNNGKTYSRLNWQIELYPNWGEWEFYPESGFNLSTEDEPVMIEVYTTAPDQKESNFLGTIKVINLDDRTDYEIIDISLETTKTKYRFDLIQQIISNNPRLMYLFSLFR